MRGRLGTSAVAATLAVALLPALSSAARATDGDRPPAVTEVRVIGKSVKGREIYAYRVGDPHARVTAVAISTMHGDEPHTRQILRSVIEGRKVRGLDLWVIPTVNPDGLARRSRKNAHGVDLNRNFPHRWTDLDGRYESGPRPASEPETRALLEFFSEIRPRYVVSYHQPLHGVDVSTPGSRAFGKRLARAFHLPRKWLTCNGGCHGTFTQWYNHRFGRKPAVTVEYGHRPSRHRMRVRAPRQLVRVLGGHY